MYQRYIDGQDEVGWHLAESLRAMVNCQVWRDVARQQTPEGMPKQTMIDSYASDASANAEGRAYGHAFRAAELAYDQAIRESRFR